MEAKGQTPEELHKLIEELKNTQNLHYKKLLCEQDIAKRIILDTDMNNLLFNYELPVKIDIIVGEGLQDDAKIELNKILEQNERVDSCNRK